MAEVSRVPSLPDEQEAFHEAQARVAWHIDKCCTGGDESDWEAADRILADPVVLAFLERAVAQSIAERLREFANAFSEHSAIRQQMIFDADLIEREFASTREGGDG